MTSSISNGSRSPRLWPALLLAVAAALTYWNSLTGPFVFDTIPAVVENPTIRHLSQWRAVLSPPHEHGQTVGGRPLVNVSFALNYAIGGLEVRGYHIANVLIHLAAALLLFGIIRRTLRTRPLDGRFGAAATPLAVLVSTLWLVHPLQTESVTYIVQRAESLMGLCFLGALYTFIRAASDAKHSAWAAASIACCFLGMAAKEVMVSAPVIILLYDRTFIAGSWRRAWQQRRIYYVLLASSWLVLGALVLGAERRGGSAGFGTAVTVPSYALTQLVAVARYLRLSFWPHPLVLDYGTEVVRRAPVLLAAALLVLPLLVYTIAACARGRPAGFAGAWFFAILAPTSSFVPVATQTIAEHRMYLPLAAVIAVTVLTLYKYAGRRMYGLGAVAVLALAVVTHFRNDDYRSELELWGRAAAAAPGNARAQHNFGFALQHAGRSAEAVRYYNAALALAPDDAETHHNLANALVTLGRPDDAIAQYEIALRLQPRLVEAHYSLGNAWLAAGRADSARAEYEAALRLEPGDASTHRNLASALLQLGRVDDAIAAASSAVRENPQLAAAHYILANALVQAHREPEAAAQYIQLLALEPANAAAEGSLAFIEVELDQTAEALPHFTHALQLAPDDPETHNNFGYALASLGRTAEARREFETALRLRPDYTQASDNLRHLAP